MLLDQVVERGFIKVGTSGVYQKANGEFASFSTDLARGIAAAIFGDANQVEFVVENFSDSLNSVANGEVDIVSRGVTVNSGRDAGLDIDYAPIYLYDYQAILTKNNSNIDNVLDLNNKTVGTVEGTTSERNLQTFLDSQNIAFTPQSYASTIEMLNAYDRGEVDAISSDRSLLSNNIKRLSQPENHVLLDTELSKEPLAMVIPENDSEWGDVVRWVTYALIQAEELDITSENIDDVIENTTDPYIRRFLGLEDDLGEKLGLSNDFVVQMVKQVGNYGEIYQRNYPDLERDRSYLWQDDGLLYSLPFSGSVPENIPLIDNDSRNLLEEIQERGVVKLGVSGTNSPGFAVEQANGEWQGFDVELGKAVAAAVFGEPSNLEIVVGDFSQGFNDVANGVTDIFAAGVTHNLARDAARGVDYSPTYLYDGQGFLVRKDSGINFVSDLNGRTIGLTSSTTGLQNIQDYFAKTGGNFIPQLYDSSAEMFAAYQRGEIDAVSTDKTLIAGRISNFSNRDQHKLLDEVISKEPLAIVVDENQSEWADIVRWVTYALVHAEELGINSENIDRLIADNTDNNSNNDSNAEVRTFLGVKGDIGRGLGLAKDFAANVVQAVGNYGEIYERNFDTDLLPRDENELYSDFGLQYSPPFTTAPISNSNPEQLNFAIDSASLKNKLLKLKQAWIYDNNSAEDLDRIDLWLKTPDGSWTDIADVEEFDSWSEDNRWASFQYELDLGQYTSGSYILWAQGYDSVNNPSNSVVKSFAIANNSPTNLTFQAKKNSKTYTSTETFELKDAWVYDDDGTNDLSSIDFWLNHGNDWYDIADATSFTPWSENNDWAAFNYQIDLKQYQPGKYTLWGQAYDQSSATSNSKTTNFTIIANSAPQQFQFQTNKTSYLQNETLTFTDAWVYDADSVNDLAEVDVWIQRPNGVWEDIDDATQFKAWNQDDRWASFSYQLDLDNYESGTYTLWAQASDNLGASSNSDMARFTVLASGTGGDNAKFVEPLTHDSMNACMIGAQTTNLLEPAENNYHSIIRHPSQDLILLAEDANYYSAASASDTAIYNRDDDFMTIIENLDSLDALLN